jgi:hypothetical protein
MAMWGAIFFEATLIVIFILRYGDTSVGRDIATLLSCGIVAHLIYLPFYYYGIRVGAYHNYANQCLNGLIVLRLCYPANHDLLARISIIEKVKNRLFNNDHLFLNTYFNALTCSIFMLCALPLCTLIFIINTDQMRATGIAIILFSFFVAFEGAKARAAAAETNADAENRIVFTVGGLTALLVVVASVSWVVSAFYNRAEDGAFFNTGYASGYSDAKSGTTPKLETDFEKALWCNMVATEPHARPPGFTCLTGKKP